jgi:hypothetical protein
MFIAAHQAFPKSGQMLRFLRDHEEVASISSLLPA